MTAKKMTRLEGDPTKTKVRGDQRRAGEEQEASRAGVGLGRKGGEERGGEAKRVSGPIQAKKSSFWSTKNSQLPAQKRGVKTIPILAWGGREG